MWGYILAADQVVQDKRTDLYTAVNIWDMKRVAHFPAVIPVNILAQVWGLAADTPVIINVRVVNGQTGAVMQDVEARGSIPGNPDAPAAGLTLSLNQIPVRVEGPGNFELRLFANERLVARHPLLVRSAPSGKEKDSMVQ